ncbi:MAG TPA: hypothetical protein PLD43_11305, partial [Anaerolineae bacterium]|nr:hypothetical protein [Anaerolineae bacterium]
GGRGWGKSYSLQRFIHRRLAPWCQAEQPPHIFIFGWCAPAHGVSFKIEISESAVSESVKKRKSEKAKKRISKPQNHLCGEGGVNFSSFSGQDLSPAKL